MKKSSRDDALQVVLSSNEIRRTRLLDISLIGLVMIFFAVQTSSTSSFTKANTM